MTGLNIQLTPQALKVVANLQALPETMMAAIARGMDKANELAIANIKAKHLTGVGPFPPEQHKLGIRTSRLLHSVSRTAARVSGKTVTSAIGSNVVYAAIHEFGGRIRMKARQVKIRHRLDARGNLMRQGVNRNLLVFAGKDHKRAIEKTAQVGEHEIIMPERAPFRTGIRESAGAYTSQISAAIVAEWKKGQA